MRDDTTREKLIREPEVVHQALNAADESWRLALEKSGFGIWDWDVPKDKFAHSRKLNQMLGHCNGSAASGGWMELVHPEDIPNAREFLEEILEEKDERGSAEYRVRCIDGTYKWVHVTGVVRSRGNDGKPVLVMGLVSDVTWYREGDHKFRKMAETIPASIFIIQDGRMCYVNPYAEMRSGYTCREFLSMSPWTYVHPEMQEMERRRTLSIEGGPFPSRYDVKLVSKSGEESTGDMTITTITYRGRPAMMGFIYDITERRRGEEALRESESKYRALFQNATDAIFLMSGETITACNEKALEMFRCERSDITGRTPFDISPPAQPGEEISCGKRVRISQALSGTSQYFEWKHRRFDGSLFDAEVSLARVELDGAPFLHCTVRDITDRKMKEMALRESEHKFRDLAEKSLVGIYLIQDGSFRYVNSRFAEIMEYKVHELIETIKHEETVLREDREVVLERLQKRISGETHSMLHTFRIVTKHGDVKNVEVYGSHTVYRGRPAVIGTLLDITERTRSEELLRQAEEKYRGIFENSVEGIFQASPSHELITVNSSLARMFGYDRAEEFISELYARDGAFFVHRPEWKEFFRRIKEEGVVRGFETEQYRRDGKHIWVSINSAATKGADGSVLRYEGTLVDVTERKEAEEKLRRSEAGLRAVIGSMSDIIVVVDKNGRYVRLSLENPDTLSMSLTGPFDKHVREAIPRETVAPFLAAVRKALKIRQTVHMEYHVGPQGEERWFSGAISPMTDELIVCVARDITDIKMAESELRAKSLSLEETNGALRALLRNMERAKKELEESVVSNIRVLVIPHIRKLARFKLTDKVRAQVDVIEVNLENIASPFLHSLNQFNLTPTEIQVAGHVRDGRTTKEIIELMHGTKDSVDMHRYHIRRKLGINRTKTNLRSYLLSLR